jgi:hypothetical protein
MKTENVFADYLKSHQKEKIRQALLKQLIILKKFKPSEKTKRQLNLPDDFEYVVVYNPKTKELLCDCFGFLRWKECKHTKYFKSFINELEKQNDNAH